MQERKSSVNLEAEIGVTDVATNPTKECSSPQKWEEARHRSSPGASEGHPADIVISAQ